MLDLFDHLPGWLQWTLPVFVWAAFAAACFFTLKIGHTAVRGVVRVIQAVVDVVRSGRTPFDLEHEFPAAVHFENSDGTKAVEHASAGKTIRLRKWEISNFTHIGGQSETHRKLEKPLAYIYQAWLNGEIRRRYSLD